MNHIFCCQVVLLSCCGLKQMVLSTVTLPCAHLICGLAFLVLVLGGVVIVVEFNLCIWGLQLGFECPALPAPVSR